MRKGKRFDNILNECLERLLEGETVEQCLQSYPEQAAELEPLLRMALVAKQVSTIQPRAEFKDRARYQFQSALREMESRRGRWFLVWQSRWATAVAGVLVIVLLGSGTVAAATNSMPDGALYPVKLATEQVRLTLTLSPLDKAQLYARLADKRVAEIVYMASKGDPQRVEMVARRLDIHLEKVAALVAARDGKERAMLAPAPAPAPARVDEDTGVLAPAPVPERAEEAVRVLPPRAVQRAKLLAILRYYAANHPDRLRAALEAAPESVKPALRRAIRASVDAYRKALDRVEGGDDNGNIRERENNGNFRDGDDNRNLREDNRSFRDRKIGQRLRDRENR